MTYELTPSNGLAGYDLLDIDRVFIDRAEYDELDIFSFAEQSVFNGAVGKFATKKAVSLELTSDEDSTNGSIGVRGGINPSLELTSIPASDFLGVLGYLAKINPNFPTPKLIVNSEVQIPWSLDQHEPYGAEAMTVYETRHDPKKTGRTEQMVICGHDNLDNLLGYIDKQAQIVGQFFNKQAECDLYNFLGTDKEHLSWLWSYSLDLKTPGGVGKCLQVGLAN
jgi:hypothetical protein